ncbi:MAG: hypothetical protein HY706_13985 [Candidatus Hydrogenedentes bacterium]|nr:hypothetical protein [Candidatus Hydrogenedentota bacterium]
MLRMQKLQAADTEEQVWRFREFWECTFVRIEHAPFRIVSIALILVVTLIAMNDEARASETDQFMAMDKELADSADALNRYLNRQAEEFLAKQNSHRDLIMTPEKLTQKYYSYLFKGLHASRLRSWLLNSEDVDRFPGATVSYFQYLRASVFGMRSFPFILPMARTIRVGDVHLGIDKMGHFFGFGRRSFKEYLRLREAGFSEDDAMEKVVLHGFLMERYFVGNLIDGIFSCADLEANFQGMMMARAFCEGNDPYFKRAGDKWVLTRPIDIRPFVTPGFDETYNRSHYIGRRKGLVFKVLRRDYCAKFALPMVQERFAIYNTWPRSFSQEVIDRYYEKRGKDPRKVQSLEAICGDSD